VLAERRVIHGFNKSYRARPGPLIRRRPHGTSEVLPPAPLEVMRTLGDAGFDATRSTSSSKVVERAPRQSEVVPHHVCRRTEALLLVAVSPEMCGGELDQVTAAIANRRAQRVSLGTNVVCERMISSSLEGSTERA
jgi:hypothetical protein